MRAWRVNELGHPSQSLRLEDVADPVPGPGQVMIGVEAGTINFADILLCQGIYQDRPGVPFTPGLETCGLVDAVVRSGSWTRCIGADRGPTIVPSPFAGSSPCSY